jgi:hypothetical protein
VELVLLGGPGRGGRGGGGELGILRVRHESDAQGHRAVAAARGAAAGGRKGFGAAPTRGGGGER